MNLKKYEFDTILQKEPYHGGAYVVIPFDVKTAFGLGCVPVYATFDGESYDGIVVIMGIKKEDGSFCYIIGVRKDIQVKIGKRPGDSLQVTLQERDADSKNSAPVDDYIAGVSTERHKIIRQIRLVIGNVVPTEEKRTSCGIPTHWQGKKLVHFSNAKHHAEFHLFPGAITAFPDELIGSRKSKGTVHFPYVLSIPCDLIEENTHGRVKPVEDLL